ncbi:hypothetical protein V1522DRAFT_438361 [Lipomyces starkeyi]
MVVIRMTSRYANQACEICKSRKKKCDRLLPTCTSCKTKFRRCNYEEDRSQREIRKLRAQLENLTNLLPTRSMYTYHHHPSPSLLNVDPPIQYPIPSRWYMPFLLNHYHELCSPSFAGIDFGAAHSFSLNSWMQAAFSDPCMFHGILFAASSHLDVLRGERDNPVTHYHRRNATRQLINNISSPQKLPDTTVAAALYLWHYESMNCRVEEAQIHKNGLKEMVKSKGGLTKLGLGGFLSHLIILIDIGDAVLNASRPHYASLGSSSLPEPPITLLSAVLHGSESDPRAHGIPMSLIHLLRQVHQASLLFESQQISKKDVRNPILEDELLADEPGDENLLHAACSCAAYILLNSLRRVIPFSSDENQGAVEQLRSYLSQLNDDQWLEADRETIVWLCFTGAAAAKENRTWFLAKVGPVVMSLKPDELRLFKLGAVHLCRLLQYLQEINA